jgi:ATP-dependent Clp protease ATP-binding subunit ClpA
VLDAVGNMLLPLAEYLISHGADLDREWPNHGSPRMLARNRVKYTHDPHTEACRRLLAICDAGALDEILAELDAKRQSPPPPEERTLRAMQLAADDAARQGQSVVTTGNMLVGLLRVNREFAQFFLGTGTDMSKLRAMIEPRLLPDEGPLAGQELPADADADAAVRAAAALADGRHREHVSPLHLLSGILRQEGAPGARLLAETGATVVSLRERLESTL